MWLRKTLILINWLILISISSHAQNLLKGVVQEKGSGKKIEFASVSLFTFPDSSLLTAVATDSKGKFQMELPAGKYYLTCSCIGYQIFYNTITIESNEMTDVGILSLEADKATLQDVTVLSKKSLLSSSIDRKAYNVEQDIMAQSGDKVWL